MRTTHCAACGEEKKIVGFKRDDPILECGHILTIDVQIMLETLDKLEKFCTNMVQEKMDTMGIDQETATKIVSTEIFG